MSGRFYTTSVRFSLDQKSWLTAVTLQIMNTQGKHLDRSCVLRGLLSGAAAAKLDLGAASTEEEIKRIVSRRLCDTRMHV